MIIDAHCHAADVWYQPGESLLFEMDRASVERAILVQILGRYDNGYQTELVRRYPDRLSSVVGVDFARPEAIHQLEQLREEGAVGVRLRPSARSPGPDSLGLWRAAARLGMPVSCVGSSRDFVDDDFKALLGAVPGLVVVLEHLGGFARPDRDAPLDAVLDLARFPGVRLKVPGLGQLAPKPQVLPATGTALDLVSAAQPILKAAEAFGSDRLMWGSDYPPVASREGYGHALNWVREALAPLGPSAIAAVFGGAAASVYRLSGHA